MSNAVASIQALSKETVSYTPSGGSARTIPAIIERPTIRVDVATGREYPTNKLTIYVANDATDGVQSIMPRYDTVAFKRDLSDAATTTFTVTKILEQDNGMVDSDAGMWKLEVEA